MAQVSHKFGSRLSLGELEAAFDREWPPFAQTNNLPGEWREVFDLRSGAAGTTTTQYVIDVLLGLGASAAWDGIKYVANRINMRKGPNSVDLDAEESADEAKDKKV